MVEVEFQGADVWDEQADEKAFGDRVEQFGSLLVIYFVEILHLSYVVEHDQIEAILESALENAFEPPEKVHTHHQVLVGLQILWRSSLFEILEDVVKSGDKMKLSV